MARSAIVRNGEREIAIKQHSVDIVSAGLQQTQHTETLASDTRRSNAQVKPWRSPSRSTSFTIEFDVALSMYLSARSDAISQAAPLPPLQRPKLFLESSGEQSVGTNYLAQRRPM
jgi:hypothetical protein